LEFHLSGVGGMGMEVKKEDKRSNLIIENRKKIAITGVEEVISFNEEVIILNTNLGNLTVKGSELKMNKLDVQNGDMMITGKINSLTYTGSERSKDKESIFSKLFR
jgi:sporulation protein YabP